jgi:hypothetical protein
MDVSLDVLGMLNNNQTHHDAGLNPFNTRYSHDLSTAHANNPVSNSF